MGDYDAEPHYHYFKDFCDIYIYIYIYIQDYIHHKVHIRLKLIDLDFIFMLHYGQRITQISFSSISMGSDYRNAVFCYVHEQRITP